MKEQMDLIKFARDNNIPFEFPRNPKRPMRAFRHSFTGRQWNQRKGRQKMAKQSRKQNRKGA